MFYFSFYKILNCIKLRRKSRKVCRLLLLSADCCWLKWWVCATCFWRSIRRSFIQFCNRIPIARLWSRTTLRKSLRRSIAICLVVLRILRSWQSLRTTWTAWTTSWLRFPTVFRTWWHTRAYWTLTSSKQNSIMDFLCGRQYDTLKI